MLTITVCIWWIYDSIVCHRLYFFKYFTFSRRIYERELNFLWSCLFPFLAAKTCVPSKHRAYASISMLFFLFIRKILFGFNYSNYNIYLAMWSTHSHSTYPHTHTAQIQSHPYDRRALLLARFTVWLVIFFLLFLLFYFILRSHLIDGNNCSRLPQRSWCQCLVWILKTVTMRGYTMSVSAVCEPMWVWVLYVCVMAQAIVSNQNCPKVKNIFLIKISDFFYTLCIVNIPAPFATASSNNL